MNKRTNTARRVLSVTASCIAVFAATPRVARGQSNCPAAAQQGIASGWTLYRAGKFADAKASFLKAQQACPKDNGAAVGLGYVDLRRGDLGSAKRKLDGAIRMDPRNTDALVGRGLVAWREADTANVRAMFERVRRIDPNNAEARDYLARIPAAYVVPTRPTLVLQDTVVYPARANGDRFDIRTATGWTPFYIKGMNLGAATPGKHPSEFPDSATYATWIVQIAEMGVNTLRVYTIHPPHFYGAIAAYNRTHPAAPLWIVHGVWTELPPAGNFDNAQWKGEFFQEMRRVVDLLHGRADIVARPGHANGHYTADISQWVLAYIIGREWEPYAIAQFNALSKRKSYRGKYLEMANGTPADAWMTEASETIVAYEMTAYRAQRPVAYTNWPTLDPLTHRTETTVKEEVAIRRAHGERVTELPKEYDNDRYELDPNLVRATNAFPAGWFASYHAYPYYPDFIAYDVGYRAARSSEGPSSFYGYLTDLKRHHRNIPVVIAEYGVPTSLGIAHFQREGWNHGGLTEAAMASTDARLTREIAEAGMAGGMLFAWIDEWFKKNWIAIDHEIPLERNRLWYNRMDAEQHYGMYAMDAKPPVAGATLRDRMNGWATINSLYDEGAKLRAAADAAYLWLLYQPAPGEKPTELLIGFDMLDPARGDTRWPDKAGAPLPVGLEFVLRAHGDTVQLVADHSANPWTLVPIKDIRPWKQFDAGIPPSAPGFFSARVEMRLNATVGSTANSNGSYSPLIVVPNRRRVTRDSAESLALAYDRGLLPKGNAPDGMWERLDDGTIEVRIPWTLLNVTDPSQRRVLDNLGTKKFSRLATTVVSGIRIAARVTNNAGTVRSWPSAGGTGRAQVATFTWPTWEDPEWSTRMRSVYGEMRATFATLKTPVIK